MLHDPATIRDDAATVVAFKVEDTVSALNVDDAPLTDPVKVVVPFTAREDERVAAPETVSGPVRLTLCPTRLTMPFPACTTTPVGLLYTAVLMTRKGHIKNSCVISKTSKLHIVIIGPTGDGPCQGEGRDLLGRPCHVRHRFWLGTTSAVVSDPSHPPWLMIPYKRLRDVRSPAPPARLRCVEVLCTLLAAIPCQPGVALCNVSLLFDTCPEWHSEDSNLIHMTGLLTKPTPLYSHPSMMLPKNPVPLTQGDATAGICPFHGASVSGTRSVS